MRPASKRYMPLVGDDVDAVLADRERVLDLLAQLDRPHRARSCGSMVPTLPFAFETNQIRPREIGQRRGDPLDVLVQDRGEVVVAHQSQAGPVLGDREDDDVIGLGRDPEPVAMVEEEIAASGEVLVGLGSGRVWSRAAGRRSAIVARLSRDR